MAGHEARPVIAKPAHGAPCNGCGYCCTAQPCALAVDFLGCTEGPCIALEAEAGRTFCGLVRRPVHYLLNRNPALPAAQSAPLSVSFAFLLRLGAGCDADDPEPEEPANV